MEVYALSLLGSGAHTNEMGPTDTQGLGTCTLYGLTMFRPLQRLPVLHVDPSPSFLQYLWMMAKSARLIILVLL